MSWYMVGTSHLELYLRLRTQHNPHTTLLTLQQKSLASLSMCRAGAETLVPLGMMHSY
jgi:hypothetical protein